MLELDDVLECPDPFICGYNHTDNEVKHDNDHVDSLKEPHKPDEEDVHALDGGIWLVSNLCVSWHTELYKRCSIRLQKCFTKIVHALCIVLDFFIDFHFQDNKADGEDDQEGDPCDHKWNQI